MNTEIIVYYEGELIDKDFAETIGKAIVKLQLRKGDSLTLNPFNHFNDEETDFTPAPKNFHTKVCILSLNYSLTSSWNNVMRTKIEIKLIKHTDF